MKNKKVKESLFQAEEDLAALEKRNIKEEIEKDNYSFMKPKFKAEIKKLKDTLDELTGTESNYSKYLKFGVYLIQNLRRYYEKASPVNKQKFIGSIFPEI